MLTHRSVSCAVDRSACKQAGGVADPAQPEAAATRPTRFQLTAP